MTVEAVALVLSEYDHLAVARVGEVRQCKVDHPIGAGERHRWFGAIVGQRLEAFTLAAGEDDHEHGWFDSHRLSTYLVGSCHNGNAG